MGEIGKHLEDIDAEFTVEADSGFGCGYCGYLLSVGTAFCPNCKRSFAVPTPSLKRLNSSRHPSKMQGMALVHKDRLIASEIKALLKQNPNSFLR